MSSRGRIGGSTRWSAGLVAGAWLALAGQAVAQTTAGTAAGGESQPAAAPANALPATTKAARPPGSQPAPSGGMSELEAVQALVEHNPNLHVALLQEAKARATVRAEEALYDPVFTANAGYTRGRSPGMVRGPTGTSVAMTTSETADLGAGISKTLPYGTIFGLSVAGQRTQRTGPGTAVNPQPVTIGPGYSLATKLYASHPFLRGSGKDVGLASLRQARLNRTAAVMSAQQTASQLLQDALVAYWELWYGTEVVRINEASRDLTREQERQALEQVASGSLSKGDALAYMTKRAERDETVVTSITDRLARAIALAQLLGQPERGGNDLRVSETPADVASSPASPRAVDDALTSSFQLKQLEAQIALARDQAKIAGNALKPKLDVEAYVQAQGLGYREVPPAFEQVGQLQGLTAHVGLTFETPLTDTRREAQIQNANLAVHIAEKQLEATRQQLRAQVMNAIAAMDAARTKLKVAEETERVAHEQTEAEQARFLAGSSIALQVQVAEDSWRQAQLRVQRAKVDLVESEIKLLHLRGRLLERYAAVLDRLRPNTAGLPANVGWGPW